MEMRKFTPLGICHCTPVREIRALYQPRVSGNHGAMSIGGGIYLEVSSYSHSAAILQHPNPLFAESLISFHSTHRPAFSHPAISLIPFTLNLPPETIQHPPPMLRLRFPSLDFLLTHIPKLPPPRTPRRPIYTASQSARFGREHRPPHTRARLRTGRRTPGTPPEHRPHARRIAIRQHPPPSLGWGRRRSVQELAPRHGCDELIFVIFG